MVVYAHGSGDDAESVLFNEIPKPGFFDVDNDFLAKWERINALRSDVKRRLKLRVQTRLSEAPRCKRYAALQKPSTLCDRFQNTARGADCFPACRSRGRGGDFKGDFEGLGVTVAHADGENAPAAGPTAIRSETRRTATYAIAVQRLSDRSVCR